MRPQGSADDNLKLSFIPVSLADAALLAAIHSACFSDSWSEASMQEVLAMPGVLGWIAVVETPAEGESPAGLALYRHVADEAEVLTISVVPAWRRAGIGRQLLDVGLSEFRPRKLEKIFLEVAECNASALSLYKKFGFTEIGRRSRYYNGKIDAIVLYYQIL